MGGTDRGRPWELGLMQFCFTKYISDVNDDFSNMLKFIFCIFQTIFLGNDFDDFLTQGAHSPKHN